MSPRELSLCVDLGTGGPKIGLVTFEGEVIAHELHQVATEFGDDGGATQDAELWWTIVLESAKRLLSRPDVDPLDVKAIAVTGQYASTVPVDEHGVPTGPCLTWLDTRGGHLSRRAVGGPVQGYNARKVMSFIRKTGGAPSTSGADPIGQILYLTHEQPELCARTRWFMEPVDYLTMRFSGVASATYASRLAMWLTDNRHMHRFEYDEALLRAVGLTSERLPPLVPTGSVIGPVDPVVRAQLGLSVDAVVIAALPDLHAAAYGAGATSPFAAHLALSTTSWMSCPVPSKKTDILHTIASVPGLTNDSFVIINNQETGAKSLEWLQGVIAGGAERMSFDAMTELAATSPPGANGVIFTPWLAGERSPIDDKNARAGFTNLSITTNTADLIRAVMEGVAANSAWLFTYVEKFAGQRLSPIRLVGGGAQSPLWCQIFADTFDRDVLQIHDPMLAQLRGMALAASVSLKRRTLDELRLLATPSLMFSPSKDVDVYRSRVGELASLYRRDRKWRKHRAT